MSETVSGRGQLRIASIFLGSVAMPSSETIWPKYFKLPRKNLHLEGLSLSPALANFSNTPSNQVIWSSGFFEKMIMSSK